MNLGEIANVSKTQVVDFINGRAWAIYPEVLGSIQRALLKCEGDIVNMGALRAAIPDGDMGKGKKDYKVEGGKAIIPVVGPLDKRPSIWHLFFGGDSTENIQRKIASALADSSVSGIVLNIDSPGGSVDGTKELSDFIYASRGKKPIVAYVDGNALSAAYWIASAADKIVAPETARAGSIGVWMAHHDASGMYENMGVKKTYIYAGKYKVAGHEAAPLSPEDKEYLQGFPDKYYSIFVEDVARNRGVSTKKVLNDMADGKIFIGTDALEAGLVDKIGTMKDAMRRASRASMRTENSIKSGGNAMTLEEFKSEYPELYQAARKEGADAFKSGAEHSGLADENKTLKEKVGALETEVGTLKASNKELEKKAALVEEKLSSAAADTEMNRILAESSIPERLHGKVKKQVDYKGFVKDGEKFEAGSESFKSFSEAFKAEVEDWEKDIPGSSSVGTGKGKETASEGSSDLEDYGREVARRYAGSIRSDAGKK